MCGASFIDMIMVVVKFFLQVQNMTTTASSSSQWWVDLISEWRDMIAFIMPNVAVKRALFNLKIQTLPQCKLLLNAIAISSSSSSSSSSVQNANKSSLDLVNKHKSFLLDNNTDWQSKGFDWEEPGIGKFVLMSWSLTLSGCLVIFLVEMHLFSWIKFFGKKLRDSLFQRLKINTNEKQQTQFVKRIFLYFYSLIHFQLELFKRNIYINGRVISCSYYGVLLKSPQMSAKRFKISIKL